MDFIYLHEYLTDGEPACRDAFDILRRAEFPYKGCRFEMALCRRKNKPSWLIAFLVAGEREHSGLADTLDTLRSWILSSGAEDALQMTTAPVIAGSIAEDLEDKCAVIESVSNDRAVVSKRTRVPPAPDEPTAGSVGPGPGDSADTPPEIPAATPEPGPSPNAGVQTAVAEREALPALQAQGLDDILPWLKPGRSKYMVPAALLALAAAVAVFFMFFYGPSPDPEAIADKILAELPQAAYEYAENTDAQAPALIKSALEGMSRDADAKSDLISGIGGSIMFARGVKDVDLTVSLSLFPRFEDISFLPRFEPAKQSPAEYLNALDAKIRDAVASGTDTSDNASCVLTCTIAFDDEGGASDISYDFQSSELIKMVSEQQLQSASELYDKSDARAAISHAFGQLIANPTPALYEAALSRLGGAFAGGGMSNDPKICRDVWAARMRAAASLNPEIGFYGGNVRLDFYPPDYAAYFAKLTSDLKATVKNYVFFTDETPNTSEIMAGYIAANKIPPGLVRREYVFHMPDMPDMFDTPFLNQFYVLNGEFEKAEAELHAFITANCMTDRIETPLSSVLSGGSSSGVQVTFIVRDDQNHCAVWKNADSGEETMVFVRADERVTFHLPEGEYTLRYCYGKEWYGEDKWFGQNGVYCVAQGNDGDGVYEYRRGYVYEETTSGGDGEEAPETLSFTEF